MLETITNLIGDLAVYISALLGLVALYFLWVAIKEWRVAQQAFFGVERDIAHNEMMGALARAGTVIVIGIVVFAVGQLGQQVEVGDEETAEPTQQAPVSTISVFQTPTPDLGSPAPTLLSTDTPQAAVTDVPPLPSEPTLPAPDVVEPTPQTATVIVFGGVWLRDAPNGGTIDVLPQGTTVEFLEGREFAGSFDWQKVQVLSAPVGSEALVGRDGWVAFTPEFLEVSQ